MNAPEHFHKVEGYACYRPVGQVSFEEVTAIVARAVVFALVARVELIDPERFGVTVARNRGFLANVFNSEAEALSWLLNPKAA